VALIARLVKTGDAVWRAVHRPYEDQLTGYSRRCRQFGSDPGRGEAAAVRPPTGGRCRTGSESHRSAAGLPKLWRGLPCEGLPGPYGCDVFPPSQGAASAISLCRMRRERSRPLLAAHCRPTPGLDRLQTHLSALKTSRVAADVLRQMLLVDVGKDPKLCGVTP
jgi:hypothetical protein